MSRVFQLAASIILVGVVVMVVGDIWYLSASSDYASADTRWIAAFEDSDNEGMVDALWDQHDSQSDMTFAGTVFDFGFLAVALGLAAMAYGLYHKDRPPAQYHPAYHQPEYPVGIPPRSYVYPSQEYPQPPPGQRH